MRVRAIPFTANGIIGSGATDEQLGTITEPFPGAGNAWGASVHVNQESQLLTGMAYKGFTGVVIYNGSDNTGDVIAVGGAAGIYAWNYEINCDKGIYIEVTGTGSGTVWVA